MYILIKDDCITKISHLPIEYVAEIASKNWYCLDVDDNDPLILVDTRRYRLTGNPGCGFNSIPTDELE